MRRARIAAVVLCGVVVALGFAATPAAADGLSATLGVATASVGEKVRVTGTGWPAQELVQLVTCGELALNGSSSCDMRSALATMTSAEGTFTVDLQVGKPPKPCPCVVHIALVGVGSQGQVDVPFTVRGHPVATPPRAPSTPAEVEVVDVRLDGGSAWTEWFGGPASSRSEPADDTGDDEGQPDDVERDQAPRVGLVRDHGRAETAEVGAYLVMAEGRERKTHGYAEGARLASRDRPRRWHGDGVAAVGLADPHPQHRVGQRL